MIGGLYTTNVVFIQKGRITPLPCDLQNAHVPTTDDGEDDEDSDEEEEGEEA